MCGSRTIFGIPVRKSGSAQLLTMDPSWIRLRNTELSIIIFLYSELALKLSETNKIGLKVDLFLILKIFSDMHLIKFIQLFMYLSIKDAIIRTIT